MNKKLIKFDWAIKKLLRNKANFGILEGFLSELLFENIKIDQILESEGNQEHETDKFNRMDILTQNSKNEFVIIEIQSTYEIDYFHRMVYGASKIITENLDSGQKHADIKKVISIHIVFFDLGQGNDYIYKGITDFKGIHQNDILGLSAKQKNTFGKLEISDIFPEYYVLKVNQFDDKAKDTLDEWIYFLKNSEIKDSFKAKGLKEAEKVLDIMRLTKADQYGYNRYMDSLSSKASEIFTMQTEAKFQAMDERSVEIAIKSILKGLDNVTISEITGLTLKKINELRNL